MVTITIDFSKYDIPYVMENIKSILADAHHRGYTTADLVCYIMPHASGLNTPSYTWVLGEKGADIVVGEDYITWKNGYVLKNYDIPTNLDYLDYCFPKGKIRFRY